ncbi:ferredoxin [Neurospora crassa]|uniref:2Fe-2S iron-sulfur cluster binding domain-containing protein n=1 Tax=Neurospora crassa (strain ATCC 24698 / 74-OR23-1A / CBS 708.71 / DSM 1257 / FGSC 987) TaxID=367110 RepID=Q7S0K4_NEUCR|nr:2Fe-2S iron-sulfur cluster binding domain-containing protein [Neurospora crassa OR74A]EAA28849.1 2Fe-2S iron-sulfur cluster binding domain-containing protein [Neurospora crassa OR74A]KHE80292.1 ferredoxin [Neurospora crassa]|eukprot:XP_958085.1 2Fe-2S iron-sulfur cluster binding domain-containing protein [Neurospora crassa OR74A]
MSTPRVLRQSLQRLAQHARCYSKTTTAPLRTQPQRLPTAWSTTTQLSASASASARRSLSTSSALQHGHVDPPKPGEELYVTFIDKDNQTHRLAVSEGDNLLDIAQAHDLEMEGACGGSCACSTCHVIVQDQDMYDRMPEPDDDENDMLDLAFGLTETSRLGCQVHMTKELDGLVVKLPSMTRNLQASDFKS